jgi:hypothetical protein
LSLFRCEVILAGLVVKTGTSNAAKPKYTLREIKLRQSRKDKVTGNLKLFRRVAAEPGESVFAVREKFYVCASRAGYRFEQLTALPDLIIFEANGTPKFGSDGCRPHRRFDYLARLARAIWKVPFDHYSIAIVLLARILDSRP